MKIETPPRGVETPSSVAMWKVFYRDVEIGRGPSQAEALIVAYQYLNRNSIRPN